MLSAARALLHPDYGDEEDEYEWVEPRTHRERLLQLKLSRTMQALHRCRDELRRRAGVVFEHEAVDKSDKPDWSLALRFRLTSELRAALEQSESGWRADRKRHLEEVARLEAELKRERDDKHAATTRLTKELVSLQRMYASESMQGRVIWAILFGISMSAEVLASATSPAMTPRPSMLGCRWWLKPLPAPAVNAASTCRVCSVSQVVLSWLQQV